MQSKLESKVLTLEATLSKIDYQLKHETQFYSSTQILIWRRSRRQIHRSLTFFRQQLAALLSAREQRKATKKKMLSPSYGHQEAMEGGEL